MQTLIISIQTDQHIYAEAAELSVQTYNDKQISLTINSTHHILTLPLEPAVALELADALEKQVQRMGGVL